MRSRGSVVQSWPGQARSVKEAAALRAWNETKKIGTRTASPVSETKSRVISDQLSPASRGWALARRAVWHTSISQDAR